MPDEAARLLAPSLEEAALCIRKLALIELFRRGEVSSGYAAEVLGMSRWDFIQLLGQHKVPYIDFSDEELSQQLEAARPHRVPR